MLERIAANDALWSAPPHLCEEVLFDLMWRLRQAEDGLFLTDRKTILLAQTSAEMPAWVWTADGIGKEALTPLSKALEAYDIGKITVKPEVATLLFADRPVIKRLTAQHCPVLIRPEHVDGAPVSATDADVQTVAELLAGYTLQAEGTERPTSSYIEAAQALVRSSDFLLWRTAGGRTAACAYLSRRSARHGCINHVSTLPELRGRGYAGAAVAELCARLIGEGLTPMLYADTDYPSSNRAYQKIGFVPAGKLVTVRLR